VLLELLKNILLSVSSKLPLRPWKSSPLHGMRCRARSPEVKRIA
jgi:hypothetical protein